MAATRGAYLEHKAQVTGSEDERSLYPARFLKDGAVAGSGYFVETDSDVDKETKIKTLFYLDAFACPTPGTGSKGFVGAVIQGETNASYHNPGRFSGLTTVHDSQTYEFLNDAGLNTLPFVGVTSSENVLPYQVYNGLKVSATVKSSFYERSTWGVKAKPIGTLNPADQMYVSSSNFTTVFTEPLGKNETKVLSEYPVRKTGTESTVQPADPDNFFFIAPNRYETRIYITNPEGTKEITTKTVTMLGFPVSVKYSAESLTVAYGNTPVTRYLNSTTLLAEDYILGVPPSYPPRYLTFMGTSNTFTFPNGLAANGYYLAMDLDPEGYMIALTVNDYSTLPDYTGSIRPGQVIEWQRWGSVDGGGTPVPPTGSTPRFERPYYNTRFHPPVDPVYVSAVNGGGVVQGYIYLDPNGKYYTTEFETQGSSLVPNGYYVIDMGFDFESSVWIELVGGVLQSWSDTYNP